MLSEGLISHVPGKFSCGTWFNRELSIERDDTNSGVYRVSTGNGGAMYMVASELDKKYPYHSQLPPAKAGGLSTGESWVSIDPSRTSGAG